MTSTIYKNKRFNSFVIIAFIAVLLCIAGLVSFSLIPTNGNSAQATLANPSVDFIGNVTSDSIGFVPGNGVTATAYELGMSGTENGNYRIESILVEGNNNDYGIYETYYSSSAITSIINCFSFCQYVFTSEGDDEYGYVAIETPTYYSVAFSGGTVNISSSSVTGIRWDGSTYTGTLAGIDAAGTYKINTLEVTYNSNTVSAPVNMHLMIILKAKLAIDKTKFELLFDEDNTLQFNLSNVYRTYGEQTNLRDLINISTTSSEEGKFYFSGTGAEYFTLSNFGKNGSGTSVNTTDGASDLSNISEYLDILWYSYSYSSTYGILRDLISEESINDAGTYSISLNWNVDFNYFSDYSYNDSITNELVELSNVVEIVYSDSGTSVDFYKEIQILQRKLYFSENLTATGGYNGGITISRSTEYKASASVAESLFTGCAISETMWAELNGLSSDYNALLSSNIITEFTGSYFEAYTIGTYNGVYICITLNTGDEELANILKNYQPVMGYYINSVYYTFASSGDFFNLTKKAVGETVYFNGTFEILPNNISLFFNAQSVYTYGIMEDIGSFDFNDLITVDGTIYTANWEVILLSGTIGTSAVRSQTMNRIYIGVMTGKKNNEATANIAYTDGDGNLYTMYQGRLYAGDYYFYYYVYVLHASTSSSYEGNVVAEGGKFVVKDSNNKAVVNLNLQNLQQLSINKLVLSVAITDMTTTKDYDGTADLASFAALLSGGSIFAADQTNITCQLSASYNDIKAGENVAIIPDFQIKYTATGQANIDAAANAGTDITTTVAYRTKNSYTLDTTSIGGLWSDTGTINKLTLSVGIVDNVNTVTNTTYPLYSRNYAENTYVLLQVAKTGDTLPDGTIAGENYYFYYYSRTNCGVIAESKISLGSVLGVSADSCIKLDISGFLTGEGFKWDHSGTLLDFNNNTRVDTNSIFSWYDSIKKVNINDTTDSSTTETDYYQIEFNSSDNLNSLFDNYIIEKTTASPEYAYLYIGKLELGTNFIFVQQDANELFYEYSAESQIASTVTCTGSNNALFNFGGHYEWSYIVDALTAEGKTIADLVEVIGFDRDDGGTYNLQSAEIKTMILAGNYTLRFTLPASKNYKGGTFEASLVISGKTVQSIITFAVRTYLDANPSYNTAYDEVIYVNNLTELELMSYWITINETYYEVIAYTALDGSTLRYYSMENNSEMTTGDLQNLGAIKVYMSNYDDAEGTMDNTIIYYGFIGTDSFLSSDTTHSISFALNSSNDKAYTGGYVNGVIASGAFKNNYQITTGSDKFYVLKKALSISVEDTEQEGIYSGNEKIPAYTLIGGDSSVGFLGVTIIGYMYNGVSVSNSNLPDNVLEVGTYTLELFARPQSLYSVNYATSRDRITITYTVTPYQVVFKEPEITKNFNSIAYTLGEFSEYFDGGNSNWGTVEIVAVNGLTPYDILEAGNYTVTILCDIKSEYQKNLYFEMDGTTYIYSKEYDFTVIVLPSASYEFMLTSETGVSLTSPQKGYSFIYSGTAYVPTYTFINIDEGVTLPVSYTVMNSKSQINPQIKNADTYTITFEVNKTTDPNYNKNYASYEGASALVFLAIINKAPLLVNLGFEDGYTAKKTYLDDNSVISSHMFMIYSGWVNGETALDEANIINNPPVIDWNIIDTNTYAGSYSIKPKSGDDTEELLNYYYDYDGTSIIFTIEKAVPYLLVYGLYSIDPEEYYDYYIYTGESLIPIVKRKYKNEFITESVGSGGTTITYQGLFTGSDKNNITESDINRVGTQCLDVGKYVFMVEVISTYNFYSFPAAYFYLEVKKAELTITVKGNSDAENTADRGYATMVYNRTQNYPTFYIIYSGFVGKDSNVSIYKNSYEIYSYNLRQNTTQIAGLALTHPTFTIHSRSDVSDDSMTPYDAGTYYIKLYINQTYGVSANYNINVAYYVDNEVTMYPELEITKRVIDITSADRIIKAYDGTTDIKSGAVTKSKYTFTSYSGITDSGIVSGDENNVSLTIDYVLSCYERKNVYNEQGIANDINIRIYGYSIDNTNYDLQVSNYYTDDHSLNYFYLIGAISQENATIDFLDEAQKVVTGKVTVEYDSKTHALTPQVRGIQIKNTSTYESLLLNVGFTLLYNSTSYSSENAPKEAGLYTVTIRIMDTNYVGSEVSVVMEIEKAEVEITFNGDASPVYGTGNMGLVAFATGIGNYYQKLAVSYYYANGDYVDNIIKAGAGTYTAKAVHIATTNFKSKTQTTVFTIRLRDVTANSDVSAQYSYTGEIIVPSFTFVFNNATYYPTLKYDTIVVTSAGRTYVPLNYDGDVVNANIAPKDVGKYRVTTASSYLSFSIATTDIKEFEITAVDLILGVADLKVNVADTIAFTYTLTGNVNNEGLSVLLKQPEIEYFNNSTGEKLNAIPTVAGLYKIKPVGAISINYNITYSFGVLTINNSTLSYSDSDGTQNILIEGSFNSDVDIVVTEINNVEYSSYRTLLINSYPEYTNYSLSTIYYLQFSDGTVELTDSGTIRVKLLLSKVLSTVSTAGGTNNISDNDAFNLNTAEITEYYIAHFSADGNVECIKATKEGDYLVFETTSLEAFCVITDVSSETNDNTWILYVAISGGILLILGVLLILKKRA